MQTTLSLKQSLATRDRGRKGNEDDDEEMAYLPSVDINRMSVAMLLSRLDKEGSEAFKIDREKYYASWEALSKAREDYYESTGKILLKDL